MFLKDIQIRENATNATYALKQLLKCNYSSELYLRRQIFHYNTRLFGYCTNFNSFHLCKNRDFLSRFCSVFPFQILKEVRLRASVCEPLLTDPELNIKIVLLVRDPRGVYNSRKHASWCLAGGVECRNATNLCNDMVSDFIAAQYLAKKYPNSFKVVRYEDLSLDPFNMTTDILNFYGLPFHESVHTFLTSHTTIHRGNIMSTYRNSTETVFAWRQQMSFKQIDRVQAQCEQALNLWGYKRILREEDLKSDSFNILSKSPFATETEYRIETALTSDESEEKDEIDEMEEGEEGEEEKDEDKDYESDGSDSDSEERKNEESGTEESDSKVKESEESESVESQSEKVKTNMIIVKTEIFGVHFF